MSDIFISYARSTEGQAKQIAKALRGLGYDVWRDDDLPAHRDYADVIEERLKAARAVVVVWSAEAVKSQSVRAEADVARAAGTMVQLTLDGAPLPMPFNRIQCADLAGWTGDLSAPGWRKLVGSVTDLFGQEPNTPNTVQPIEAPAGPAPPNKPSIAVLPFDSVSGNPEQETFADDMVAEITSALSRFRDLFVIASSSTLALRGQHLSAQDAARRLGVRYIVEGRIRRSADRVRIAARLIDVDANAEVWTDRFDDTLEDLFSLQDMVARSIAGAVWPALTVAEIRRSESRPSDDLGSQDLYRRAWLLAGGGKVAHLQAIGLLERAIELDPNLASAQALLASLLSTMVLLGWTDDEDGLRRRDIVLANRAALRASDDSGVLWQAAHAIWILRGDPTAALSLTDRSLALNPASSWALQQSGFVRTALGMLDEAVEQIEAALRLDQTSGARFVYLFGLGMTRFAQGRFAEAVLALRESLDLNPRWPVAPAFLAASDGHLGAKAEATEAVSAYRKLTSKPLSEFIAPWGWRPELERLFLEGAALAEAKEV